MIIKAFIEIENPDTQILNHFISHPDEYSIAKNRNESLIEHISNIESYNPDDKYDITKLRMMQSIASDILQKIPSPEDLDENDDAIELYDIIRKFHTQMSNMGW